VTVGGGERKGLGKEKRARARQLRRLLKRGRGRQGRGGGLAPRGGENEGGVRAVR
jgi:hypothetical protein